ncbi:MAG: phenylalanine--tRNA ligase subunit alpha, partial [Acidimicrobiaceae bacterium]|nr:phenylalanine--tRNA ligase subunit alpha [Acidimicrobiaceae bacterium]
MMEGYEQAAADAAERLAAAADLDAVAGIERELLGRGSQFTEAKRKLGELDPSARAEAGRLLNDARGRVEAAVAAARARLTASGLADRYAAEQLDLTERLPRKTVLRRGHFHPVTQARDRLEDVFVGMGYTVAEGPEVESAWYNFEALNIPDWHPARGSFDTIFVNLGEPEEVMLRSHTSPVQIRVMENRKPPIYIV